MSFSHGRTFLLGIGFMSVSVVWSIYNTFLPPIYDQIVGSTLIVGLIMTIDNVLALFIQPWIGAKSDRTWTRLGRRFPYILVGMPLAGVLLFVLPGASLHGIGLLLVVTVLMNIGMAISRTPIVSLMADLTPSENRSTANGIINLMGGLGAGIALFLGGPLEQANVAYPFYFAGVVALVVPLLLRLFITEPEILPYTAADANGGDRTEKGDRPGSTAEDTSDGDDREGVATVMAAFRRLRTGRDRSGILILLAIFSWFIAFAGAEALFSLYGQRVLGLTPGQSGQTILFLLAMVVIFALPAGMIGQRIGRRRAIMIGLIIFGAMFFVLWQTRDMGILRTVLPIGGIGWSLIVVNSLPMVLELGRGGEAGAYTGLYYVASMTANIVGPPLLGGMMDWITDDVLFLVCAVFTVIAFSLMLFVKGGEAYVKPGLSL